MREKLKSFFRKKYAVLLTLITSGLILMGSLLGYFWIDNLKNKGIEIEPGSKWIEIPNRDVIQKKEVEMDIYDRLEASYNQDKSDLAKEAQRLEKKAKQVIVEEKRNKPQQDLYTTSQVDTTAASLSPKKEKKAALKRQQKEKYKYKYRAIIGEDQEIEEERNIQIHLTQSIDVPELDLRLSREDYVLNALPVLTNRRIHLKIVSATKETEAEIERETQALDLYKYEMICLDTNLTEGLFQDGLAALVEERVERELASKVRGSRTVGQIEVLKDLLENALTLSKLQKKLTIPKGRELFIAFGQEVKN